MARRADPSCGSAATSPTDANAMRASRPPRGTTSKNVLLTKRGVIDGRCRFLSQPTNGQRTQMISRTELAELSEADLRRSVLIPMFRAMGFSGVQELHGPTEFGKDIVMRCQEGHRPKEVYAVVVKTGVISGKVEGTSGCAVAFTQALQALGSRFSDKDELRQVRIDKVWILTSGGIRKAAADALTAAFAGANVIGKVRLIDGDELWRMLKEFSPERTAVSELLETSRLFESFSPNYRLRAAIRDGQVHFGIAAKHSKADEVEPLHFNVKLVFPNTAEGKNSLAALDAHIRTGSAATIPGEFVASINVPAFLEPFFGKQPRAIELKSTQPAETLPITLIASHTESDRFELTGFRMRCIRRGTDEATFETESPYGCDFVLVLNRATHLGTLKFKNFEQSRNARQNWLATQFFTQLSKGGHLSVCDDKTGLPFLRVPVDLGQIQPPNPEWLQFSEALDFLQAVAATVITIPDQVTRQDVLDVIELVEQIRAGIWHGGLLEVSLTIKPDGLPPVMQALKDAPRGTLTVTRRQMVRDLRSKVATW